MPRFGIANLLMVAGAVFASTWLAPTSAAEARALRPYAVLSVGQQVAELSGSDARSGEWFGNSVAVSGTTIVVGTPFHNSCEGGAYVFVRTPTGWHEATELEGSDTTGCDWFGDDVAISGNIIVVGAPNHASNTGRAYVFTLTDGVWQQTAELKGSDSQANGNFGGAVGTWGNTIVVGGSDGPQVEADGSYWNNGRAFVFTKTVSGWHQVAEFKGSDTVRVTTSGAQWRSIATTSWSERHSLRRWRGEPMCSTRGLAGWHQSAELPGPNIADQFFGCSVAISGDTIVVGGHDGAEVYTQSPSGWQETTSLIGSDTVAHGPRSGQRSPSRGRSLWSHAQPCLRCRQELSVDQGGRWLASGCGAEGHGYRPRLIRSAAQLPSQGTRSSPGRPVSRPMLAGLMCSRRRSSLQDRPLPRRARRRLLAPGSGYRLADHGPQVPQDRTGVTPGRSSQQSWALKASCSAQGSVRFIVVSRPVHGLVPRPQQENPVPSSRRIVARQHQLAMLKEPCHGHWWFRCYATVTKGLRHFARSTPGDLKRLTYLRLGVGYGGFLWPVIEHRTVLPASCQPSVQPFPHQECDGDPHQGADHDPRPSLGMWPLGER